jgi:formylglycine-generating enzyme
MQKRNLDRVLHFITSLVILAGLTGCPSGKKEDLNGVMLLLGSGNSSAASAAITLNVAGDKRTYTVGSVSFKQAYVPAKSFPTGTGDTGSSSVTAAYEIGETEVTYELWNAVRTWAESNGYTFANAGRQGGDNTYLCTGTTGNNQSPVTCINWRDTIVWSNALTEYYNAQNGTSFSCVYTSDAAYTTCIRSSGDDAYGSSVNLTAGSFDNPYVNPNAKGFRLPTMAERELAARYIRDGNADGDIKDDGEFYPGSYASGADAIYSATSGGSDHDADGDIQYTDDLSWNSGNSGSFTHVVKTKAANTLGLYDMSGNVWEWDYDWNPSYVGTYRVQRGGSWGNAADAMRVGYLMNITPYDEYSDLGFRLSRTP